MQTLIILSIATCMFLTLQIITPSQGHAKGHGESCTAGDTAHYCDPTLNLDCINSICECKSGYLVNPSKVCEASINTPCGVFGNETSSVTVNCYSQGFLNCVDSTSTNSSTCQCPKPTEQIFDATLKACAQTLNTTCPMDHSKRQAASEPGCVSNAFCEMVPSGHFCKCNSGFVPANDTKTCTATAGSGTASVSILLTIVAALTTVRL